MVAGIVGVERMVLALDVCDKVVEKLLVASKKLRLDAALHGGRRKLKQIVDDKEANIFLGSFDGDAATAHDLSTKWRHEFVPRTQVVLRLLLVGENGTGE